MRRKPVVTTLGVAVIAVAATLAAGLGRDSSDAAWSAGSDGVEARTSLAPRQVLFGDTVRARVVVAVDRSRVDTRAVRIATDFTPFEVIGSPRRQWRQSGETAVLSTDVVLRCLARDCMPTGRSVSYEFPPARITYVTGDGREAEKNRMLASWPPLVVQSRITGVMVESGGEPSTAWRADLLALPEPSYRVAPVLLLVALLSGAVLAGLAAAFLAFLAWPRKPPSALPEPEPETVPGPVLTPLEHALLLLEDTSRVDGAEDRRRALELVAEELELADWGDDELARSAKALAWSAGSPPVDRTSDLAARVRSVLPEVEPEIGSEEDDDEVAQRK